MTPPQQLDALWAFARAATSKSATEAQSKSVKAYMPQADCELPGRHGLRCSDRRGTERTAAAGLELRPDRPASYKLSSARIWMPRARI